MYFVFLLGAWSLGQGATYIRATNGRRTEQNALALLTAYLLVSSSVFVRFGSFEGKRAGGTPLLFFDEAKINKYIFLLQTAKGYRLYQRLA